MNVRKMICTEKQFPKVFKLLHASAYLTDYRFQSNALPVALLHADNSPKHQFGRPFQSTHTPHTWDISYVEIKSRNPPVV